MLETKRKWTEIKRLWIALGLILFTIDGHSQVKTFVDSTAIKIGEELIYNIELEVDSSSVVVFPKGQPFGALELIEDYKTDKTPWRPSNLFTTSLFFVSRVNEAKKAFTKAETLDSKHWQVQWAQVELYAHVKGHYAEVFKAKDS